MTIVLIKRGNLDIEMCPLGEHHVKIGMMCHKPRNYQKLRESLATKLSRASSAGV